MKKIDVKINKKLSCLAYENKMIKKSPVYPSYETSKGQISYGQKMKKGLKIYFFQFLLRCFRYL